MVDRLSPKQGERKPVWPGHTWRKEQVSTFMVDSRVRVWYLYLTLRVVLARSNIPNNSSAITLIFITVSLPHLDAPLLPVYSPVQAAFLPTLHIQMLLLSSPGEQNAGVLQMYCQSGEQGKLSLFSAGWQQCLLPPESWSRTLASLRFSRGD